MTVTKVMTAEDLWELPEVPGKRFELARGELIEVPGSGYEHAELVIRLLFRLYPFVVAHDLGSAFGDGLSYVIGKNPDVVRVPDLSFISKPRLPRSGMPGYVPFAPDLAVEIVPSNDRAYDVRAKVAEYLDGGTRLVWVLWPGFRSVSTHATGGVVRELGEDDELDGGGVLPGFRVRVGDLFGATA